MSKKHLVDGKTRKFAARRRQANKRQLARNNRSSADQVALLDSNGWAAVKERARLIS